MAKPSAKKLLRELIAIPSVNPAFLPERDTSGGEMRLAEFLMEEAVRHGLAAEWQKVLPRRPNLFIRFNPAGATRQHILLAPHMDTVGSVGHTPARFTPKESKGRLYGRGACDTKGSIAAMLTALIRVVNGGRAPKNTAITLAALVDEEDEQRGSRAVARSGLKADLAIVGEPTGLSVVTAHKGDLWLKLETLGRSAHGARPELGRNAVHEMARVVDILETRYASQLRKRRHALLGHPTINVGSIRGGTQSNVVPAQCEIGIDRRTIPGESEAGVCQEIKSLLARHRLKPTVRSAKKALCWPMETDPNLPLVREFMQTIGQRRPVGVDFFCDASVLAGGGIPCVVFGPGDIAQAHTADEWISLPSLEAATELLTRFLQSLP